MSRTQLSLTKSHEMAKDKIKYWDLLLWYLLTYVMVVSAVLFKSSIFRAVSEKYKEIYVKLNLAVLATIFNISMASSY